MPVCASVHYIFMQLQMKSFGWNTNSLVGLVVYLLVGGLTFLVDIAIIYGSMRFLDLHYPVAVALGFVLGAFFNYAMNRRLIYHNSKQSHRVALVWFFGIAFVWLWFTVGGTVFLVELCTAHTPLGLQYCLYISRTLVGLFVCVAGYVLNSLFTFRMV